LTTASQVSFAGSSARDIDISYVGNRLTLSAKEADLETVLMAPVDSANFYTEVPISLFERTTINLTNFPLKEAIDRLLTGLNHLIIYSGTDKSHSSISEVYVLPKIKRSKRLHGREKWLARRMAGYQKQIESLNRKLSNIDQNSRHGKIYLRRIKLLNKQIESLERRLR
jgi:hypothetical protein